MASENFGLKIGLEGTHVEVSILCEVAATNVMPA